jgi:hypothetical protein
METRDKRVLILGAGFGGLYTALAYFGSQQLGRSGAEIYGRSEQTESIATIGRMAMRNVAVFRRSLIPR